MRILIIDVCGAALDWALRCQDYGHEIKWYIDKTKTEKKYNWIGTGLVPPYIVSGNLIWTGPILSS